MKKSEIFNILLDKVCEVCEVTRSNVIRGSKIQAVVDARILAIQFLRRAGLTNDDIALIVFREQAGDPAYSPDLSVLKKKAKGIDKSFRAYLDRCLQSYAFCLMSVEIKTFCAEMYEGMHMADMKPLPPSR